MEPPGVIRSAAPVMIATAVVAPVMIATATVTIAATAVTIAATGAGVTARIGIPTTAGVGSRSGAIPTTATPSSGIDGHQERGRADGNSRSEYFAQHNLLIGF
jgi:hypothetical protein